MTTKKKIILLTAVICYTGILYGFLADRQLLLMIMVILFGVLMSVFSLSMEETDPEAAEKNLKKLEEAQKSIRELEGRISTLAEEKECCERTLQEAVAAKEKASLDLQQLQIEGCVEKADAGETQQEKPLPANFLPPADGEGETLDIIQIARETMEELKPFAEKAELDIRISAAEERILVRADAARLRILFRNIMDNSIKYMNRAGVLIVTISNLGDDIFIVLKDNGNGLSEKETAHIFELNYQGSNRISGNGLGLTQAKAIVEYYGGTIYAKSNIGKGMGIYVQLPTD